MNPSSKIFAYNKRNLKDAIRKYRGSNLNRVLKEIEFMRTHKFKKGVVNPYGHATGMWVKRDKPLRKVNIEKLKKEIRRKR